MGVSQGHRREQGHDVRLLLLLVVFLEPRTVRRFVKTGGLTEDTPKQMPPAELMFMWYCEM